MNKLLEKIGKTTLIRQWQPFHPHILRTINDFAINDGAYVSWARIDDVCIRRIGTSAANELTTAAAQMRIFPNPTRGAFTLDLGNTIELDATIVITDMLGSTVMQQDIPSGTSSQQILLENAPNGLYIVQVMAANGVLQTGKVQLVR